MYSLIKPISNPCMARCKNAGFPGSKGSLLKALIAEYCKLFRITDCNLKKKYQTVIHKYFLSSH